MSWLSARYTYSLRYQMNKINDFYVWYWIFGNLNYPAITNICDVNQKIRYNGVQRRPRYNEHFSGTVELRSAGCHCKRSSIPTILLEEYILNGTEEMEFNSQ